MNLETKDKQKYTEIQDNKNINEHYLNEPALQISTDKRNLDTFKLLNEPFSRKIDIKSYKISDAEYIKSLYSSIENTVIQNSESTLEVKPIDYQKILNRIMDDKLEANKQVNINLYEAISKYKLINYYIDEHTNKLSEAELQTNKIIKEILLQKKLILSNLALCFCKKKSYKEAIELDLMILGSDRNFEKSYVRLINCHIQMGNLEQANYYANLFKGIYGSSIVGKHPEIFNELEEKNQQADENLKKLSKRMKKRESEVISEIGDDTNATKNEVSLEKKSDFWWFFKLIFGTGMIIASSLSLVYLYKTRSKYILH